MQIIQTINSIYKRQRIASRIERKPALKISLILIALLVTPYLLTFGVEFIQRRSIQGTWQWMTENVNLLTLNVLIDSLIIISLYCLINSLIPAIAISTILFFVASIISYFKVKLIGIPFFPWDLHMNKELIDIIPLVINRISRSSVIHFLGRTSWMY
jgi:hypothetical protein